MSGFVANGKQPSTQAVNDIVRNNGFFPDISLNQLRVFLKVDGSVKDERLFMLAQNAMFSTNQDLESLVIRYREYSSLADIGGDEIGGESMRVVLYQRAVFSLVGAELSERYRSYDVTNAGNSRADELTPSIDEYRRDHHFAIRDLRQMTRITVELI